MVNRYTIEQVYCRQVEQDDYSFGSVKAYTYDVHYITKRGGDVVLVKGLDTYEQALFIERQIERMYQITDTTVVGEHSQYSDSDEKKKR